MLGETRLREEQVRHSAARHGVLENDERQNPELGSCRNNFMTVESCLLINLLSIPPGKHPGSMYSHPSAIHTVPHCS